MWVKQKKYLLWLVPGLLLIILTAGCGSGNPNPLKNNLLNFGHLEHLYERIQMNHRTVGIIHIYSEAPDYGWMGARGEGITCVDDVARAAVLYLRQYRSNGDETYFKKSRSLIRFVMAMQASNGLFYNFLLPDHRINKTRRNSVNRLDFWTARAVWALGEGYLISKDRHPTFADSLRKSLERVLPVVQKLIQQFPKTEIVAGKRYPTWLINRYAADATSELLLGLVAFEKATADPVLKDAIEKLSVGLIAMQQGDWQQVPYGAHLSYPGIWHGWGNAQTEVLSRIGKDLNFPKAVASAKKEADGFFSRLLIDGWKSSILLSDSVQIKEFPQIAYEVRTVALGLENLYKVTGEKKYAVLAGLAGSWFLGNNSAGSVMYDFKTGRCFDGIESRRKVNLNSGAESTIEALLTLQALQSRPVIRNYLFFLNRSKRKTVRRRNGDFIIYRRYLNKAREKVFVSLNLNTGKMNIRNADAWDRFIKSKN